MKLYIGIIILFCITLTAMENPEKVTPCLNFILNSHFCVKEYSIENVKSIDFPIELNQVIDKHFFDLIPMNAQQELFVTQGFNLVRKENSTIKVPYFLNNKSFQAKITLLDRPSCAYDYFVKVKYLNEKENQEQYESRLNFLVDDQFHIKEYSAENMHFPNKPTRFIGKSIFSLMSLKGPEKERVIEGFKMVYEKGNTLKLPYPFILHDQKFSVTITLLKYVIEHKLTEFEPELTPLEVYDYFIKIKYMGKIDQ